jgi:hypothetical protein
LKSFLISSPFCLFSTSNKCMDKTRKQAFNDIFNLSSRWKLWIIWCCCSILDVSPLRAFDLNFMMSLHCNFPHQFSSSFQLLLVPVSQLIMFLNLLSFFCCDLRIVKKEAKSFFSSHHQKMRGEFDEMNEW